MKKSRSPPFSLEGQSLFSFANSANLSALDLASVILSRVALKLLRRSRAVFSAVSAFLLLSIMPLIISVALAEKSSAGACA